jgi:hypothetical protein
MASADRRTRDGAATDRLRVRIAAGSVAVAAGGALIGSSFLGWITTPMAGGGRTAISGWGSISGGDPLVDGVNFNTLMAGVGSYRPGAPVLVMGAVTVIPGLILAVTGAGRRPSRVVGAVLALCGVAALIWGLLKAVAPGDALGVLPDGQGSPGAGPVLAAVAGLAILVVAGLLLAGLLDPAAPVRRAGVQPGRR